MATQLNLGNLFAIPVLNTYYEISAIAGGPDGFAAAAMNNVYRVDVTLRNNSSALGIFVDYAAVSALLPVEGTPLTLTLSKYMGGVITSSIVVNGHAVISTPEFIAIYTDGTEAQGIYIRVFGNSIMGSFLGVYSGITTASFSSANVQNGGIS